MTPPINGTEAQVRAAVARVAARIRLRDALTVVARSLLLLGVCAVIAVAAVRFAGLTRHVAMLALGAATAATAVVVALLVRPVSTLVAASMADRALGLADRMTSAITFLDEGASSALQRAAIEDAARVGDGIDARRVVVLRAPRAAWFIPALALAVLAVGFVHLPAPTISPEHKPPKSVLVVEPDALAGEVAAVHRLAAEARGKDAQLSELAEKLDALLAAVDKQTMSRAEVFAQLAALETQYAKKAPSQARPSELLAPAAKVLAESKVTRALADAIKKDDLEHAKEELEKLAAAAEARDKDKQEESAERELERALDQASRKLDEERKKDDAERDKKIDQLKDEERRLKKQQQEHPQDEETERRLKRNKRELERLEREKQEQAEQRRQLERLQKDLQEAAEQLRNKMTPEAMRQMAKELGQMQDEIRKLGSSSRAQMQIAELKEVLRRASRIEAGKGQNGQNGEQSKQPGSQKGGRGDKLRDFDQRAGGDTLILGGGNKPGENTLILPLPMGGGGEKQAGQETGPDDKDPRGPGDGIGNQHDSDLFGNKTSLKTNQKLIHATGTQGAGPSRSQTILEASERGFSKQSYKQVYKDYSSVVEEVMSEEGVPPGYRYYVKRYFQLIRPRE